MTHRLATLTGQIDYYHNQLLKHIDRIERFGVALLNPTDLTDYELMTNNYANNWEYQPDSKGKRTILMSLNARLTRLIDDIEGDY